MVLGFVLAGLGGFRFKGLTRGCGSVRFPDSLQDMSPTWKRS